MTVQAKKEATARAGRGALVPFARVGVEFLRDQGDDQAARKGCTSVAKSRLDYERKGAKRWGYQLEYRHAFLRLESYSSRISTAYLIKEPTWRKW